MTDQRAVAPLAAVLLYLFAASSYAVEGMYFCQGNAAAGFESGTGMVYQPASKLTLKVKSDAFSVVRDGDPLIFNEVIALKPETNYGFARAGVGYFALSNKEYFLHILRLNSEGKRTSFVEEGVCEKW